jgi:uncharacterized protein YcbX
VHVSRIGFTSVKGGRHRGHPTVDLGSAGPVGDRVFCLVDAVRDRCLRTVENPTLLRTEAAWEDGTLTVDLPDGRVAGEPVPTGDLRKVDYWGRSAKVEIVDGPWADAYSAHLGRPVLVARTAPGEVVYGGSVTLVTTSSLALLSEQLGRPVEGARFRPTFLVDTGREPPYQEDGWRGRTLSVGPARVRVRGPVPRCAVVDLDPASGARNAPVMRTLGRYRRDDGEVTFGVDAEIVAPGRVKSGDRVELRRD